MVCRFFIRQAKFLVRYLIFCKYTQKKPVAYISHLKYIY